MQQNVFLCLVIIGVLLGVLLIGRILESGKKKRVERRISELWGKPEAREYEYEEFENLTHYFYYRIQKKEWDKPYIDDITWNDLDMDRVFCMFNHTYSAIGQEYLYFMLRTPQLQQEPLNERERLIHFFQEHPERRLQMQCAFFNIGRNSKLSVIDYVTRLTDLETKKNTTHYIAWALLLIGVAGLLLNPGMGILLLIVAIGVNVKNYYTRKGEIEPYIQTFSYLMRMLQAAESFERFQVSELQKYLQPVKEAAKQFSKFRRGSRVLVGGTEMSGSLEDTLMDYVRILTHIDLLKFNSMLVELKKHTREMEIILENLGFLESIIAVTSVREFLPLYTVPELTESREAFLEVEDVYHPLIEEPVANSLKENKGVLVTGSNASGKSTFLKIMAINAILAQTVFTCTATLYRACFFQIYSSMALTDNLIGKESYYMVEIKSLKRILNHIKDDVPIVCFVDEVLRGTNTVERIAASSQILKSLAKPHIMCFAATHDIELTHLLQELYSNYHFQEQVQGNDVIFDYRLYSGRTESRNAIKLLQMIGYDSWIISDAEQTAQYFLETGDWRI